MARSLRLRWAMLGLSLLSCFAAAWAWQASRSTNAKRSTVAGTESLARFVPPGALLTVEATDFSALVSSWNSSPEQRAWLASDNHSIFLNSRLAGRLDDARKEFEGLAAGAGGASDPINSAFLQSVAGKQSFLAWYDIGKLEFVYLTLLAPGQASNISLLNRRGTFSQRQAGDATFYMRTGGLSGQDGSQEGQARTVGFALLSISGRDVLVLGTREDLIARTLERMNQKAPITADYSVAGETWYSDASSALPDENSPPLLHMVLNLQRIVRTPYFRSYWMQRNITAMGSYRAAAADLYSDTSGFREDRVLLPASAAEPENRTAGAQLTTLAGLAPQDGVFRATSTTDPAKAVEAIEQKILNRSDPESAVSINAPEPELEPLTSSGMDDLETFIDTPPAESQAVTEGALEALFAGGRSDAVMSYSAALPSSGLWVHMRSAVVVHGSRTWNPVETGKALSTSLQGAFTTASLGTTFTPQEGPGGTLYALTGPQPLAFAVPPAGPRGDILIVGNDVQLVRAMLMQAARAPQADETISAADYIGGFDHSSQRAAYKKLFDAVDGKPQHPESEGTRGAETGAEAPTFFAGNMGSLSNSFRRLLGVRITQQQVAGNTRQTLVYRMGIP